MDSAERGEAPPPYSALNGSNQGESEDERMAIDVNRTNKERLWKEAKFHHSILQLTRAKINFWLHPFLAIGCFILAFSTMAASKASGKETINLLQGLTPIILSTPLIWHKNLKTKDLAGMTLYCVSLCVFSHFFLTINTLCKLSELKVVPSNDTMIVYPDRSSECVNLFIHWLVSLIILLSLIRVNSGLWNFEDAKKFLTVLKWNGKYFSGKYDKTARLASGFKTKLMKSDKELLEVYTDLVKAVLLWIFLHCIFSIIHFLATSKYDAISSTGHILFAILVALLALRGRYRLSEKKSLGMTIYILILLASAVKLICMRWTPIVEVFGWVWLSFTHNGFKRNFHLPAYPLVELIDPNGLKDAWMPDGPNLTGHVAKSTGEVVEVLLAVAVLSQLMRLLGAFDFLYKRVAHIASLDEE